MGKKVKVSYAGKTKLVTVDLDSFDETQRIIKGKFKLDNMDDYVIQAQIGGDLIAIEDDDDLENIEEADMLLIDPSSAVATGAGAGAVGIPQITKEITIDGEQFSLDIIPASTTALVKKEQSELTGDVDLPGLVGDLLKLGSFIRLAYYGVSSDTDLQIKVQKVGFEVVSLCQESDITVVQFKNACSDVVQKLQCTYLYLLDGYEDIAIDTLKDIGEIAKKMEVVSENLAKEFKQTTKKVRDTLYDTIDKRGQEEKHKQEMVKLRHDKELEEKQEKVKEAAAKEKGDRHKEEAAKASTKLDTAEKNLDHALGSTGSYRHSVLKIVTFGLYKGEEKKIDNEKRIAQEAREMRLKALEEMERQGKEELEAKLKLLECVSKIKHCKSEANVSEAAILALQGAEGALAALSMTMLKATKFWRLMHEYCNRIGGADMARMVQSRMKESPAKRLEFWCMDSFKTAAVRYYSKWVAIGDVCLRYRDGIRKAEEQMHMYMKENPKKEEARIKTPELAHALESELRDAITQMETRQRQEQKDKKDIQQEIKKERT